jgi:hypothetical protein
MRVNHLRMFLHAFRTALIIVAGFLAYEILIELEKLWNKMYPNKFYNLTKRKLLKLLIIFIIDLLLLYFVYFIFKIEL